MNMMIYLYLFIIGMLLGSFYNVVGLRLPKNESIISPRSHCVNCNHKLSWYELIPVFSYIFLRGKCKKCKKKISIQYPLVEFTTGLLFMISYYKYGFNIETIISIVVCSIVIITIISDCKYMVILDEVLLVGGILILILDYFGYGLSYLMSHILGGILLFLLTLFIKLIGDKAFKQESLGWGDVKLSIIAGLILGFKLGIVYIFIGAVLALPYALYSMKKNNDTIIPFGPFLVISLLLIYWNMHDVLNILNFLLGVD